jgi:hypothetical protein
MVIFYHYSRRWLLSKNFLVTWDTKLGHRIWTNVCRHQWLHLCHHMWLHRWRYLRIPYLIQYIDLGLDPHIPISPYDGQHCFGLFPPPSPPSLLWYHIFIKLWLLCIDVSLTGFWNLLWYLFLFHLLLLIK